MTESPVHSDFNNLSHMTTNVDFSGFVIRIIVRVTMRNHAIWTLHDVIFIGRQPKSLIYLFIGISVYLCILFNNQNIFSLDDVIESFFSYVASGC